jgi:hypothetical protein
MFSIQWFITQYSLQNQFLFNQCSLLNLLEYEKAFKSQGPHIKGKVLSDGACMAIVFYFMVFFQNSFSLLKGDSFKFFQEIKSQLSNSKEMMPHYYFWMGLQGYLFNDFRADN